MNAAKQAARFAELNARFPAQAGTLRHAVLEARRRTGDANISQFRNGAGSATFWDIGRNIPTRGSSRNEIWIRGLSESDAIAFLNQMGA